MKMDEVKAPVKNGWLAAERFLSTLWWVFWSALILGRFYWLVASGGLRVQFSDWWRSDFGWLAFSVAHGLTLPLGIWLPLEGERPRFWKWILRVTAWWLLWLCLMLWQFITVGVDYGFLWLLAYGLKALAGGLAVIGAAVVMTALRYHYYRRGAVDWPQLVVRHLAAGIALDALLWRSMKGLPAMVSILICGGVAALILGVRGPAKGVLAGGLWIGIASMILPFFAVPGGKPYSLVEFLPVVPFLLVGALAGALLRAALERLVPRKET